MSTPGARMVVSWETARSARVRSTLEAVRLGRPESLQEGNEMGHIRQTFHVDAPIERVWELGGDANRYPEWQVHIIEVRNVSGPIDHVGASYEALMRAGGRRIEVRLEVTKAEKPRHLEQRLSAPGGGGGFVRTAAEPAAEGGTDCTFELDYDLPGGFVGGLADRLFVERAIERDSRHTNENFKELLEAEVKAPV